MQNGNENLRRGNGLNKLMKKFLSFLLLLSVILSVQLFSKRVVFALDLTDLSITNEELYNATNTYKYKPNHQQNGARYDLTKKDASKKVSDEKPLMTVFTHGLGGDASHWSNDGKRFAYSNDSLITRLAKTIDSNIYWVKYETPTEFKIIDISEAVYNGIDTGIVTNYESLSGQSEKDKITDISKHTIVVFNASYDATSGRNDGVYTEFNYAISRIVYDISQVNNGVLPTMNLIGHSRGGITNMQYALDHPDLVHSIYSLGTPYTGSTSASLDLHLFGSQFAEVDAENDIVNKEVYSKYMDRWNVNYNELYSHINVMALGGYTTLLNLALGLTTEASLDYYCNDLELNINRNIIKYGIPIILGALDGVILAQYFTPAGITKLALGKMIVGAFSELATNFDLSKIAFDDIVQILTNEINLDYHFPFVSWYNDGLVDLGSQLGYEGLVPLDGQEYKGFKRVKKAFTEFNCNFDAVSVEMPAVVHNLEARDKELGTYIISDISVGFKINKEYEVFINDDGTATIESYIGKAQGNSIEIPAYIDGKKVVAIADYAFANNVYGQTDITSIIIPASVKIVGEYAFYNSPNIANITFETGSELTTIETGAFSLMDELKNFQIPNGVNYIEEKAFANSGITFFYTGSNSNYVWQNGLLIEQNISDSSSYNAIYADPTLTSVEVPSSVKILSASLFENNRNIKSIDLNNVEYIGVSTFKNSTLLTVENGQHIKNVDNSAFIGTEWLANQKNEFVVLGSVLLNYLGNDSNVTIPENITKISEACFDNENIESIILPTTLKEIGANAFTNCDNLKWILFASTQPPILNGDIAKENVVFYVKQSSYNYFKDSIYYKYKKNTISKKNFTITFKDIQGNILGTRIETYGSSFDNFITEPSITGKDFLYWIDENNNQYPLYSYLQTYNNLELEPVYEVSKYMVNLINDDNNKTIEVSYGETIHFEIPIKNGYRFTGWYDSTIGGNMIVNASGIVIWTRTNEIDNLYAQYELIEYSITFETNYGEFVNEEFRKTFSVENPLTMEDIPELKRFGYIFDYWSFDNQEFEDTFEIYKNITLSANWLGKTLKYNIGRTYVIKDEYAVIDLSEAKIEGQYIFTIAPSVKSVSFLGGDKEFSNMRIVVSERSGALILGFDSISFMPVKSTTGNGYNAIDTKGNFELYVVYKGECRIKGGEGANGTSYFNTYSQATNNNTGINGLTGGQGYNGGCGIVGYKIHFETFNENSYMTVLGGTGGQGGRGGNGQQGSNGVNSPSGSFLKPKKGDNGAKGGTGGTGGRGGDGGYAIKVAGLTYLTIGKENTYKFVGGSGGDGGAGGIGGSGGIGASDISANIFNGVGDPGDGGNGGTGGQGGRGGNGSNATNALNIYGIGGQGGQGGFGSRGGYGGEGGSAGANGADGDNGANGASGGYGENGSTGNSGYNTSGNMNGFRKIKYPFEKKFLVQL